MRNTQTHTHGMHIPIETFTVTHARHTDMNTHITQIHTLTQISQYGLMILVM